MKVLLADKGQGANYMIDAANKVSVQVVISPKARRKIKRKYDAALYKEMNLIERMFNKLKNFRRVATRYDKLDIACSDC